MKILIKSNVLQTMIECMKFAEPYKDEAVYKVEYRMMHGVGNRVVVYELGKNNG